MTDTKMGQMWSDKCVLIVKKILGSESFTWWLVQYHRYYLKSLKIHHNFQNHFGTTNSFSAGSIPTHFPLCICKPARVWSVVKSLWLRAFSPIPTEFLIFSYFTPTALIIIKETERFPKSSVTPHSLNSWP